MRWLFFVFLFGIHTIAVKAQTIPVFSPKQDTVKKPKKPLTGKPKMAEKPITAIVKDKPSVVPTSTIKFVCDVDAFLYVDGEKKGDMKKEIPVRVILPKGEYLVKVVNAGNESSYKKFNYKVTETGIEKLEEIELLTGTNGWSSEDRSKEGLNIEMVNVGSFSIGKYEVTQMQWKEVMGNNPSDHKGCEDCPVDHISWDQAQEFTQKLNAMTGKNYRLPSEEEWEFAAKGGSLSHGYTFAGGNDINAVGWYADNSNYITHPVGLKRPNELGIYDMTGNVWEWCSDWFDYTEKNHVLRGGGLDLGEDVSAVTHRDFVNEPDGSCGFRLVLSN